MLGQKYTRFMQDEKIVYKLYKVLLKVIFLFLTACDLSKRNVSTED